MACTTTTHGAPCNSSSRIRSCFAVLSFLLVITGNAEGVRLNSEILVFGNLTFPSEQTVKGSLLVRPPAPTPEKALPYANEAADFTEGNTVSHTVKGKEKAKILLEDGQIPKGMHFQLRADILNNRKWFQAQTIVLNEFSTYTFTLPYDDPESNTQVWIAASVVIPLAASERRILKLKDRMCFCILTQTKTMELRSDFVAKVDWNFHEDSAPYAECIMKNINRTPLEWLSMMVGTAWVAILCLVCILILLCWWKSGLHHVKDSKWERDSQGRLRSKV